MTSCLPSRLLTPQETAEYLSVSKRTLKRLVSEKKLAAIKVRGAMRFRFKDIEAFIERSHWA